MKGGFVHNSLLAKPLAAAATRLGFGVAEEAAPGPGRCAGTIDLLIETGGVRIAVEVERSARRVERDLAKAASAGASELWIVVPTAAVGESVRRHLRAANLKSTVGVAVLTLPQAVSRLAGCAPSRPRAECGGEDNAGRERNSA